MYGAAGSSTYDATHENKNKSTILTNLETWYENKLTSYQNYLADTIWCDGKSTTNSGYGTKNSFYGACDRYSTKTSSLICPNDKDDGKLSKFTANDTSNGNGKLTYKIGLLTSDEIIYAGLKWYVTNTNSNYLKENVSDSTYW